MVASVVDRAARPKRLLAKFTGVALIGFLVSAGLLHEGLEAGLRPWAARLVALVVAMHVTFFINGRFVFRALTRQRFLGQWAAYVTNSACGNFCNYWVFVTLESTHRPVIGNPYVALLAGSATAWAINFTGARLVVFGDGGRRLVRRLRDRLRRIALSRRAPPPAPASVEPESSPR